MLATFNNETNNVSFSEPTESEYEDEDEDEKRITVFIEQKIN
jgi:hypothetical protein